MKAGSSHYNSTTISYRALIIGGLLIPINLYWLTLAETIYQPVFSTLFTLFYNVTFTLFLLVLLNAFLNKYAPNAVLQPIELLIIYVMIAIATGIFGHDLLLVMVQHLTRFLVRDAGKRMDGSFWQTRAGVDNRLRLDSTARLPQRGDHTFIFQNISSLG